ncbi:hypothetical protein BC629DRAFT_1443921 [Irpex lacteus]|nr:hypothetical protein BC629DRAFT_1443921 [Irpex lacteus]
MSFEVRTTRTTPGQRSHATKLLLALRHSACAFTSEMRRLPGRCWPLNRIHVPEIVNFSPEFSSGGFLLFILKVTLKHVQSHIIRAPILHTFLTGPPLWYPMRGRTFVVTQRSETLKIHLLCDGDHGNRFCKQSISCIIGRSLNRSKGLSAIQLEHPRYGSKRPQWLRDLTFVAHGPLPRKDHESRALPSEMLVLLVNHGAGVPIRSREFRPHKGVSPSTAPLPFATPNSMLMKQLTEDEHLWPHRLNRVEE